MKKKVLSILLSLSMIATVLTGCGSTQSETDSTTEGTKESQTESSVAETKEETAQSADTEAEPVTISILSCKTEEGPQQAFKTLFDGFTAEHPNVTFEIETMTSDDLKTAIRARAASGDMPDMVTWMKEIDTSYLVNLNGDAYLANINQETLSGANAIYAEGETYAMPLDNGYIGLFYNKDVLAANNLEVPQTYDEMLTACQTLEAKGVTPFSNSLSDLSVPYIGLIGLFAENVYYKIPDWSAKKDAGEITFATSEEWKKAFDQLKETVYAYGDPQNAYNNTYDDCAAKFANGEYAFYFEGSWALSSIRAANAEANIGITGFPVSDKPDDAAMLIFPDTSLSVCSDSENVGICKEFLEYCTSVESGTVWSENCAVSSSIDGVSVDWDPIAADIEAYTSTGKFTALGDRVLRTTFTDKLWEIFSYYMLDEYDWDTLAATLDEYWDKAYAEQQ